MELLNYIKKHYPTDLNDIRLVYLVCFLSPAFDMYVLYTHILDGNHLGTAGIGSADDLQ